MTTSRLREEAASPELGKLLREYERQLAEAPRDWPLDLVRIDHAHVDPRRVEGVAWRDESGRIAGLALWDMVSGVGRRARIYLKKGYQNPEGLGTFLDELEADSDRDGPLASFLDLLPGLSAEAQEECLSPRGYFHLDRLVLRLPKERPLPHGPLDAATAMHTLRSEDEEALVRLMRESYDSWASRLAPWLSHRDPREDAQDAVRDIFEGRRGEWLSWASYAVDVAGGLAAATLVSRTGGPVISDVMVTPRLRRIGLGRQLLLQTVRALREREPEEPCFVTTARDLVALRLFRGVGFEIDTTAPPLGLWVSRAVMGTYLN